MWTVALSQLRRQPRRYVAVVLSVLIGTMFLATASLVGSTTQATLRSTLGSTYAGADLVVDPSTAAEDAAGERLAPLVGTAGAPGELGRLPGVAEAYAARPVFVRMAADGAPGPSSPFGTLQPVPQDPRLTGQQLVEGAFPAPDADGVVLDTDSAGRLGLRVGDTLMLDHELAGRGAPSRAHTTVVTGLVPASPDPLTSSGAQLWGGAPVVAAVWDPEVPAYATRALLRLSPGADPSAVHADVERLLREGGVKATVQTPDEAVRAQLTRMGGGTDVLAWALGAFAVLALLVTALVIANTFQVLVAQRTRDLALLRTVGASAPQVRGAVLVEALVSGLVGAVAGVVLAVGLTAAGVSAARGAFDLPALTFGVDLGPLLGAALVGTAVAVLAALVPARAATRVAPLQALRPAPETPVRSRAGVVRTVVGVVLAVGGGALMWSGAWAGAFAPAVGGGALSFPGVFLLARLFVPAVVRGAAVLARPAGVPGRLAGLNATRHRSRTAATAAALLVGTTLVALVLTGGRTAQQETDRVLDVEFPVDLVVSVPEGRDLTVAAVAVAGRPGVAAAAAAPLVGTTAKGTPVHAVDADALRRVVARSPEGGPSVGETGTVYTPAWAEPTVAVTVDGRASELQAVRGSGLEDAVFVTTETARDVAARGSLAPAGAAGGASTTDADGGPHAPASGLVLVSLAAGTSTRDLPRVVEAVTSVAGEGARVVEGGAPTRTLYAGMIDALLWIVVALLAVSVLIALIGVATTLSLSVIERTRENALLRALGLTRGGLRGMIALEAVLIAAVAAALGCALGVCYGWAGSQLVLGELVRNIQGHASLVRPAVPWAELAAVVGVAALAGLAASVLPARRAARMSPVEGMAAV